VTTMTNTANPAPRTGTENVLSHPHAATAATWLLVGVVCLMRLLGVTNQWYASFSHILMVLMLVGFLVQNEHKDRNVAMFAILTFVEIVMSIWHSL
jgi:hypothetical protein